MDGLKTRINRGEFNKYIFFLRQISWTRGDGVQPRHRDQAAATGDAHGGCEAPIGK